jgi:antitoxin ChpS
MDYVALRRAGGSLTLTIPRALVRDLGLSEGARLAVTIHDGKLVAQPLGPEQPRYTLEELLAQCDPSAPRTPEDETWLTDGAVGAEII